jgi:hypothetical protein
VDTLDDLVDVTITSAANGDLLKWNGTAWVNAAGYALLASPTFTGTVTIPSGASISGFAPLASPTFSGTPTLPTGTIATTQTAADNSTKVATTAFVRGEVTALVNSATATLDTLGEIAAALGNDANLSATLTTSIGLKAPLASPTFTGTVTLPSGTVTSTMILDGTIANADISTTAAIDLGKLADVSTSAQTASYTLVLADKNKIVEMSVATANTLTVPPNASVAYAVGSQINILQTGAGQTTVTAGAGVTINAAPGLKMRTQWSYATLVKRATNTWVLVGDISA